MYKILNILTLSAATLVFTTSCENIFEPAEENNLGMDYMYQHASYAEGILANAYINMPCSSYSFNDVATDDAVSNDADNTYRKLAAGTWTANDNPESRWQLCRSSIQYINLFLANADKVEWADDAAVAAMYNDREKGEAYGLRAMHLFYLLQAHGGYDADGNLLGVPIVTDPENTNSDFNLPRNTFADCMKAIYDDCEKALTLLPSYYHDVTSASEIPSKYKDVTLSQYNRVFGAKFNGRMDGAIVEAFRSKASLLAASPAYNADSNVNWEDAANDAATVLDRIGSVSGMDPNGFTWYANTTEIEGLANGENPKEILWRTELSSNNTLEARNFPPTLFGDGRINPTQNLVDAFPAANGYPITDERSGYDATIPYDGRDPRLSAYIIFNGCGEGVNDATIITASDGDTRDGLNKVTGSSTRTGYYMRKLLRQDINLDPTTTTVQKHYTPRIRFTEIFLNYAEAANESWGPQGKGTHGYSAYDVIKAIRSRAGVGTDNGDEYLESIKDDQAKMRTLIHNERRIELSFEGFRFWDIRRWKADLNETAKGVNIKNDIPTTFDVDARNYKDYMYYGPVPYSETLKFDQLKQNKGW